MLVCHCMAVDERELRQAIADGARDAFDIAQACDAGTVCGSCVPTICALLRASRKPTGVSALTRRLVSAGGSW